MSDVSEGWEKTIAAYREADVAIPPNPDEERACG
jgi:hypothetical protein